MDVEYSINGTNFRTFGVFVAGSSGITDKLKRKEGLSESWAEYHGKVYDLSKIIYEERTITLSCFIEAANKGEFLDRANAFLNEFDKTGTQRLQIDVIENKPLVYEIFCPDAVSVDKKWNDSEMVGTFSLKLIEPDPVKRVIKGAGATSITLTCSSLLTIFWGDGTKTDNVSGTGVTLSHNTNGYIIIAGRIDLITGFSTTGTVIWNKL
ncbi:MAG: hypothetical protein AB2L20_11980 [Mangrovibacterium sp.]